jgi:hypothetical protein
MLQVYLFNQTCWNKYYYFCYKVLFKKNIRILEFRMALERKMFNHTKIFLFLFSWRCSILQYIASNDKMIVVFIALRINSKEILGA